MIKINITFNKLQHTKLLQIFKFAFVGGLSTLLHLAVGLLLIHFIFEQAFYANLAAYFIALPISFFGHTLITFKKYPNLMLFWKFFTVNTLILVFTLLVSFIMDSLYINKYLSTLVSISLFPAVSYISHTYFTFRHSKD